MFPVSVPTHVGLTAIVANLPSQSVYSQKYVEPAKNSRNVEFDEAQISGSKREETEIRFNRLVEEWRSQRSRANSFVSGNALLPAYQGIIEMGPKVLPYILRDLIRRNEEWYWALKAISGEDPVPNESRGKVVEMRLAWLAWGRRKGYVR